MKNNKVPVFSKVVELCCDVMFELSKVVTLFAMVIIVYEVVARYIFNAPTIWVIDVSRYSLVYMTLLAGPALLLRGGHVNVDLVVGHVSAKARLVFDIIGMAVSAVGMLILFLFTAASTWETYVRKMLVIDPIEIPKWIPLAVIPVGIFFLCLACLVKIERDWSELKVTGSKEVDC